MQTIAKTLIIFGAVLIGIGVLLTVQESIKHIPVPLRKSLKVISGGDFLDFANKLPFVGRLPGDIYIQKKNFTFYFPLATSILISIILSLIFWLWPRR